MRIFNMAMVSLLLAGGLFSEAIATPSRTEAAIYGFDFGAVDEAKKDWVSECLRSTPKDYASIIGACSNLLRDRYFDRNPDQKAALLINRSSAKLASGDMEGAIADADKAARISRGSPDAENQRCWTRGYADVELDKAMKACLNSIAIGGAAPNILDSLALLRMRLGHWREAIVEYDLAAKFDHPPSVYGKLLAERWLADDPATPPELRVFLIDEKIPSTARRLSNVETLKAQHLFAAMGFAMPRKSERR